MGASTSRPTSSLTQQEEKAGHYRASEHRHERLHAGKAQPAPAHDTSNAEMTISAVKAWDSVALHCATSRLAAMTLHNTSIKESLRNRRAETADQYVFNHVIPEQGAPIQNQKQSGRCWIFATCNVIRVDIINALKVKEFELSESYLAFWDLLEKSNTFLEYSIMYADRPLDDRVYDGIKESPTYDGGWWFMAMNLVNKYGLVPKSVFPESFNSSNTNEMLELMCLKLSEYALELRKLKADAKKALSQAGVTDIANDDERLSCSVRERKDAQMAELYRMMVIAFGVPPQPDEKFTYEYFDKNEKFQKLVCTPKEFLKQHTGDFDTAGSCTLAHDPRNVYEKLVYGEGTNNVWGGDPLLFVNTPIEQMKQSVVNSIKAGVPVWFGCDVNKFRNGGVMDTAMYGYELPFSIKLGMSKAERIAMGSSNATHAMVITGVHLDNQGKPVRYRVENSWGESVGEKGYMVMSDEWFDEYTFEVVIRKEHMPSKLWNLFEAGVNDDTIRLKPWDPMGGSPARARK